MNKTHVVSVRDFRQNLSLYLRAAQMKKVHFVVMRHLEVVAELSPPKKKKAHKQLNEELLESIRRARAQWERGEYYTTAELRKRLGLPSSSTGYRKQKKI